MSKKQIKWIAMLFDVRVHTLLFDGEEGVRYTRGSL